MVLLRPVKRLVRRLLRPATLGTGIGVLAGCVLFLYLMLAYRVADDPRLVPESFRHARRPILITAHPDDETLFFSPSILYHRHEPHVTRSLLVISSGEWISCRTLDHHHHHCLFEFLFLLLSLQPPTPAKRDETGIIA